MAAEAPDRVESTRPETTDSLQAVLTERTRPPPPNALSASLIFTWRALLKIKHVPIQLWDVIALPVMSTLLFSYLFGGALAGTVTAYVQFLIPAITANTVVMITMYTGIGLNEDINKGIFDRFRTLPLWGPAPLVGALLADAVRYTIAALTVLGLGLVIGFRPEGGAVGLLLGLMLLQVFAFSLSWVWTLVGLLMPTPQSVSAVSVVVMFPLTFISSIFVDPATMPALLEAFARANPISHLADAERGLMHGTATMGEIGLVLASCALMIAVFGPLTMYAYRNKGAH